MHKRVLQLDILRAVAVILVLFYHWPEDIAVPELVKPFKRFGWSGVDLFFVLSGFLVSGLLFKEYRSFGKVDVRRFLIRRGFKIYPAFYVLIGFTLALLSMVSGLTSNQKTLSAEGIIGELFFLQNYVGSLWGHTWSLAVEEHFYLSLSILILALAKLKKGEGNPFRRLVPTYFAVAAVCLSARIAGVLAGPVDQPMQATHLRIDALAFGVLLSYYYHFYSDDLAGFVSSRRRWLLFSSLALLLPVWLMDYYNPANLTIGLTMLYAGFGGILLLVVHTDLPERTRRLLSPILKVLSVIGVYSYSIYLWHWPILSTAPKLLSKITGTPLTVTHSLAMVAATVVLGIAAALIVEAPFLKMRDRLFPSRRGGDAGSPTESRDPRPAVVEGAESRANTT